MKFKIQKVSKEIYKVTEPYFLEYANIFVFCGKSFDLVVDGGIGLEDIKSFLVSKGFNPRLFLTHGHFDHCGGLRYFEANDVLMMPKIRENLGNRELLGLDYLDAKYFVQDAGKVLKADIPSLVSGFRVFLPENVQAYKGKTISNGSFSFETIHMPGHTDDSYVLFEKTKRILVTGDALYDGEIYTSFSNSNTQDFLASLKKMRKLDFDVVLPGHNEIMDRKHALGVVGRWIRILSQMK
ncbi:MAG: MBL fold metallo-hydrolase [Candidatus Liptonbacteria bacterium]|nr:MBL fold metallo-hydrolase [Candidatus Liptonbacteria bacterium]